jgi:two-component system cell cycle response regulator PopA
LQRSSLTQGHARGHRVKADSGEASAIRAVLEVTIHARALILAKDDRLAGPLAEGLDRLDWKTVTARGPHAALMVLGDLQVEAVIIDATEDEMDAFATAARMKAAYAPRRLPILALGAPGAAIGSGPFDLVMAPPLHASQVAMRLDAMVRLAVAEEEFELRAATFADRGRRLEAPVNDSAPLQILTVGEPAPKFLALTHALRQSGAETTGAFTAFTAFDYLHERAFDAVVLWAGETHAEALSIASGMRRNTRLFHVPTVLYQRVGAEVSLSEAYNRGLSDIAAADTPEADTASRVVALARAFRRETAIRKALDRAKSSGLMDAATGLFTRDLFAAHLSRLAKALEQRNRPLSIAVLRIGERPDLLKLRAEGWIDRAIPQIGSMIGRLVRAEDTAARLAPDVFALALPAATQAAAKTAAERIAAVIACTAFDAGDGETPFTIDFGIGAAEVEAGESPAQALERAAARAMTRKAG